MPEIKYITAQHMTVLTVKQATEILHKNGWAGSEHRLRQGIKQGVYPFGVCVEMSQDEYEIYKVQLDRWIAERLEEISVPFAKEDT